MDPRSARDATRGSSTMSNIRTEQPPSDSGLKFEVLLRIGHRQLCNAAAIDAIQLSSAEGRLVEGDCSRPIPHRQRRGDARFRKPFDAAGWLTSNPLRALVATEGTGLEPVTACAQRFARH